MLQDWGTANAKFYGRLLWKPPNSEKYNPKCEACEDKRSQCFAVSDQFLTMEDFCRELTLQHISETS